MILIFSVDTKVIMPTSATKVIWHFLVTRLVQTLGIPVEIIKIHHFGDPCCGCNGGLINMSDITAAVMFQYA